MAETTRRKPADKLPITRQPWFPVVVVLWCGALLGLASLAIRPSLIEGVVLATGVDQIIPQAAPPLGNTTRILIAMMMTALGCLIGLAIARRFTAGASGPAISSRRRTAGAEGASPVALFGARAPADEEPDETPVRKRQLTIASEQDDFADHAPLPGSGQILQVADLGLASFDEEQETWLRSTQRREVPGQRVMEDWEAEEADDEDQDTAPELGSPHSDVLASDTHQSAGFEPEDETSPAHDEPQPSNRLFEVYARRVNASLDSRDVTTAQPGFVSLPRFGDAPGKVEEAPVEAANSAWIDPAEHAEPATHQIHQHEAGPSEIAGVSDESGYANAAERIATAPLNELSHVELLERLGQTITRRRAEWARAAHAQAEAEAERQKRATAISPAEITPVADANAIDGNRGEVPFALRPLWHEDDADASDDDALPGYVPPRQIAITPVPTLVDTSREGHPPKQREDDILAAGYSSLLGMTKPTAMDRQPPVHPFPLNRPAAAPADEHDQAGASSPAPPLASVTTPPRAFDAPASPGQTADATEQALRAALATLQRMSGAA